MSRATYHVTGLSVLGRLCACLFACLFRVDRRDIILMSIRLYICLAKAKKKKGNKSKAKSNSAFDKELTNTSQKALKKLRTGYVVFHLRPEFNRN